MATVTLKSLRAFPAGTTVNAYKASDWSTGKLPPAGAPPGVSVASGVVAADGTLVLTGLTEGVTYFAYAQVGGVDRYVAFTPDAITPLRALDKDNGQPGILATTPGTGPTTAAQIANRAYVQRVRPSRDMTIISVACIVNVAASLDDACDVGIYDATLATRLGSAGATTGRMNSTGVKNIPLTAAVALKAGGIYYAAFSYGAIAGTVAQLIVAGLSNAGMGQLFGTTPPTGECFFKDASHPLPTAIAAPTGTSQGAPILALRET